MEIIKKFLEEEYEVTTYSYKKHHFYYDNSGTMVAVDIQDEPLRAVQVNWRNLEYVEKQTMEICREAVKQNPLALKFVQKQSKKLCREALTSVRVSSVPAVYKVIKNKTEELTKLAIELSPHTLEFVDNPSEELIKLAVGKDGGTLKYVKKQTLEICLMAINSEPYSFQYVKDQTPEIIKAYFRETNLPLLSHLKIPQTEELCKEFLLRRPENLKYCKVFPKKAVDKVIGESPALICELPDEEVTDDRVIIALRKNPSIIKEIYSFKPQLSEEEEDAFFNEFYFYPETYKIFKNKTEKNNLRAVKLNGAAIKYIKNPSEEVKWGAVESKSTNIRFIPDPSREMCLYACEFNGDNLEHIKWQDEEICIKAINSESGTFAFRGIKFWNDNVAVALLKRFPQADQDLPKEYKVDKVYRRVMKDHPEFCEHLESHTSKDLLFMYQNNKSFDKVEKKKSIEFLAKLVNEGKVLLDFIPNRIKGSKTFKEFYRVNFKSTEGMVI